MSSYFIKGVNIFWFRDEILGCDCNEKMYRYVYCFCFACNGRVIDRKTEFRYWKEICQLVVINFVSVVNSDLDNDLYILGDIFFEDVGESD